MSADSTLSSSASSPRVALWRYIFAGLSAGLVSIALARFAYTPLIPPLIEAHWFSSADIIYLSAANLAGYLLGAILGRPIARKLSNASTLRLMMVLVTLAFLACAMPLSVSWFFFWRLISGVAGGVVMVLLAATILPHVPPERRGSVSGAIFLGLGLGIAGSGTLVPVLLHLGLWQTWLGLGLVSAIFTVASWQCWPRTPARVTNPASVAVTITVAKQRRPGIVLLYIQYALCAVGLVPAMVFLVDFVARGLGAGAHQGALFWIIYGVGAIFGPLLYGFLIDRIGARPAIRFVLLAQMLAMAGACATSNLVWTALFTLLAGTFPAGVPPLMLARVRETLPGETERQNATWSHITTAFAAFQALAGYAYSAIFNSSGNSHRLLFVIAAAAFAVGIMIDIGQALLRRPDSAADIAPC